MNPRIESSINRIADEARGRYEAWLTGARNQTSEVAGRVKKGKKPVKTLSQLAIKLSGVSHRATNKIVRQQTKLVEHQIDAFAGRLQAAARAESLTDLVRRQFQLIPENASTLLADSRATLSIVADAGGEARDVVLATVKDLRKKATAPRTTRSAAAKKTAAAKAAEQDIPAETSAAA